MSYPVAYRANAVQPGLSPGLSKGPTRLGSPVLRVIEGGLAKKAAQRAAFLAGVSTVVKILPRFLPFWVTFPLIAWEIWRDGVPVQRTLKFPGNWNSCAPPCPTSGNLRFVQVASGAAICPVDQCIGSQALPFAPDWPVAVAPSTNLVWKFQHRRPPFLSTRYWGRQAWVRPIPGGLDPKVTSPYEYPEEVPVERYYPSFDPFVPPGQPQPGTRPLPYTYIPYRPLNRPDRAPGEQTQVGPAPKPVTPAPVPLPSPRGPGFGPDPFHSPRHLPRRRRRYEPYPGGEPRFDPSGRIVPGPRGIPRSGLELFPKPGTRTRPGTDFKKPPKGTKERKFIGNINPASRLGFVAHFVTETVDAIGAIYKALPGDVRRAAFQNGGYVKMTPQAKAQAIFDHFELIDINQAIENLVLEQLEDIAYGILGKLSATAARKLGLTGGTIARTMGNIRRAGLGPV